MLAAFCFGIIWKLNIKCLTLYSHYFNNLKTEFMGKKKKPMVFAFDLDEFNVRVTNERVDIETRSKVWKTVFFAGTVPYNTIAKLLVPEAFAHIDPRCAEMAKDEKLRQNAMENVKAIALDMFAVAVNLLDDPMLHKDIWAAVSASVERRQAAAEKPDAKLTLEEQAIIAEEKALADPSEENIQAARIAREAADNPPKKGRKTKKKE